MRRGRKMARELNRRIKDWEGMIKGGTKQDAYRKPGGRPGDYTKRYGG